MRDGDGPPVPGFGHAAAMTAPALLNKTIIRNSAKGQTGFSSRDDWLD